MTVILIYLGIGILILAIPLIFARKENNKCPCGKSPGCEGELKGAYLYDVGEKDYGNLRLNWDRARECIKFKEQFLKASKLRIKK